MTGLIKRGNIYWVKLDSIEGSEIGKTRPAVVISNDINNELADTITVLPVTSSVGKVYPFEVFFKKRNRKYAGGFQGKSKSNKDNR